MADVDLKLSERAGSAATCVFCREPLGAARVTCQGCDVSMHATCRAELSKCPTLGCAQTWTPAPRPAERPTAAPGTRTPRAPTTGVAWRPSSLPLLVVAAVVVCVLVVIVRSFSDPHRDDDPLAGITDAMQSLQRAAAVDAELTRNLGRLAGEQVSASPLIVAGHEGVVWRAGTLEAFEHQDWRYDPGNALMKTLSLTGSSNGLSLESARGLMAGARQRVFAALPAAAADAWATFAPGASARVRFDFDREEVVLRDDGVPVPQTSRARFEVTFVLEAVRDDATDLRVSVAHSGETVSWSETWPRQVDPALRETVLRRGEEPATTVVVQGDSPSLRHVAADAAGVRVEAVQEDTLPVPWKATVTREAGGRSWRVSLELLEWIPGG